MPIKYDGLINIALGRSRKETFWRNREIAWSAIIAKLQNTHRTAETYADYIAARKERQAEIKDVGGFVGGHLAGGKRGNGKVVDRQLITLDVDFADGDFWLNFELFFHQAALVYSTHKHRPETPRLRLIMPLSRSVTPEEYEAIARYVAGKLDIEVFDTTTFQPSRLMYYPSTASDGEYYFQFQDGPFLDADEILSKYPDWRDSSYWPVSSAVTDLIHTGIKKQGNPTQKPGMIGAFCRAYGIEEAIAEFLPDEYEACNVKGRYTYLHGSTSAGLVIYDDIFAYSHHGTDPISGKLCNAFDLVRLHKFGLSDMDVKENTSVTKLPSYAAMCEFAAAIPKVRKLIGIERLEGAKLDFHSEKLEAQNNDWLELLDAHPKTGEYKNTIENAVIVLRNDPKLKGIFAFDEFRQRCTLTRNLPWRSVKHDPYLKDSDEAALRLYFEKYYRMAHRTNLQDAITTVMQENAFHPVRDYLDRLEWDGIKRLDSLYIDYLGAADTEYMRAITRKSIIAAVSRIYEPGIKFDNIITFAGPEGIGKSTLINRLGGKWYSDSFTTVNGKEACEQIQGVWLVEMAELSGIRKAEAEAVKHFASKQMDSFRPAYGHNVVTLPRQCIFFATTNKANFLKGVGGDRRFWVVACNVVPQQRNPFDLASEEVDQIWAEAAQAYVFGETLHLPTKLETEAREIQRAHKEADEREGLILDYLETSVPADWDNMNMYQRHEWMNDENKDMGDCQPRMKICAAEIWRDCLGLAVKDMTPYNTHFIHDLLVSARGWEPYIKSRLRFGKYGVQKAYVRKIVNDNERKIMFENEQRKMDREQIEG